MLAATPIGPASPNSIVAAARITDIPSTLVSQPGEGRCGGLTKLWVRILVRSAGRPKPTSLCFDQLVVCSFMLCSESGVSTPLATINATVNLRRRGDASGSQVPFAAPRRAPSCVPVKVQSGPAAMAPAPLVGRPERPFHMRLPSQKGARQPLDAASPNLSGPSEAGAAATSDAEPASGGQQGASVRPELVPSNIFGARLDVNATARSIGQLYEAGGVLGEGRFSQVALLKQHSEETRGRRRPCPRMAMCELV